MYAGASWVGLRRAWRGSGGSSGDYAPGRRGGDKSAGAAGRKWSDVSSRHVSLLGEEKGGRRCAGDRLK